MAQTAEDEVAMDTEESFCGFANVNQFVQNQLRQASVATQLSNQLPATGDDYDYYSCFETYRNFEHVEGGRLLNMMQRIFRHHGIKGNLADDDELDDVGEKFDIVTDANDHILEKVSSYLDEATGVHKPQVDLVVASLTPRASASKTQAASWNKKSSHQADQSSASPSLLTLVTSKGVIRPQTKFQDFIDNSARPFEPKLPSKPNAIVPLAESIREHISEDGQIDGFTHPYQYELDHFSPSAQQLERVSEPLEAAALADTPLVLVTSVEGLRAACAELKKQREIAVDVEHHSMFSYLGLTCLVQVSSRTTDYIIDPFDMWEHMHLLNDVFSDPNIVKVFHGSDSDVEWLQRDFGVYIVNMFDTFQAASLLNFEQRSLAVLLSHYCHVTVDKQYQRADWRIRPLPDELINYAREDTHYLLYVYDRMRNDLIDRSDHLRDCVALTLERSRQLCLKRYEKPIVRDDSHLPLYRRNKKLFNSRQMCVLKTLYAWRDKIARIEDDSTECVLPKLALLKIADVLPRDPEGVRACCSRITPLISRYLADIHAIVKRARDMPLEQLEPPSVAPSNARASLVDKTGVIAQLNCPHDWGNGHTPLADIPPATLMLEVTCKAKATSDLFNSVTVSWKVAPSVETFVSTLLPTKAKGKAPTANRLRALIDRFLPVEMRSGDSVSVENWLLLPHKKPEVAPADLDDGASVLRPESENTAVNTTIEEDTPLRHKMEKKRRKKEATLTSEEGEVEVLTPVTTTNSPLKKKAKRIDIDEVAHNFQQHTYDVAPPPQPAASKGKSKGQGRGQGDAAPSQGKGREGHSNATPSNNNTPLGRGQGQGQNRGSNFGKQRGGGSGQRQFYDPTRDLQFTSPNFGSPVQRPRQQSAGKSLTYSGRGGAPLPRIPWPRK